MHEAICDDLTLGLNWMSVSLIWVRSVLKCEPIALRKPTILQLFICWVLDCLLQFCIIFAAGRHKRCCCRGRISSFCTEVPKILALQVFVAQQRP